MIKIHGVFRDIGSAVSALYGRKSLVEATEEDWQPLDKKTISRRKKHVSKEDKKNRK